LEGRGDRPAELAVGQDDIDRVLGHATLRDGLVRQVHRGHETGVGTRRPAQDLEGSRRDLGLGAGPIGRDHERAERCHFGLDASRGCDVAVDHQNPAASARGVKEERDDGVDDHLRGRAS